ncbi:hypothetical protein [Leucobacter sp. GX0328]
MSKQRVVKALAAACAAALLVGLSACSTETPPQAKPTTPPVATQSPSTPKETSEESPTETPAADPVPIQLLDCADLIPVETVRSLTGHTGFEVTPSEAFPQASPYEGPVASDTFMNAVQSKVCVWGVPATDGLTQVIVTEITDTARATLTSALDDSVFTKTATGNTVAYMEPYDRGLGGPWYRTYLFNGNIWVSEFSNYPEAPLGSFALEQTLAANPHPLARP